MYPIRKIHRAMQQAITGCQHRSTNGCQQWRSHRHGRRPGVGPQLPVRCWHAGIGPAVLGRCWQISAGPVLASRHRTITAGPLLACRHRTITAGPLLACRHRTITAGPVLACQFRTSIYGPTPGRRPCHYMAHCWLPVVDRFCI